MQRCKIIFPIYFTYNTTAQELSEKKAVATPLIHKFAALFNNQLLYIINHFIENFTLSYLISYLSTIQPDYNIPLYFATRVHHINILEFAEATRSLHYPTHIITLLFSLSPHSTSSSPYPISHIIPQRQPLIARFPHHHLQNINNLSQTQQKIFSAPFPPILTSPNAIDSHSAAQILFIEPSRMEFGNIIYSVKSPRRFRGDT